MTAPPDRRCLVLYGELPTVPIIVRIPVKGVAWRKLMEATRRLVKQLTATPHHKPAPYWNIDGDAPGTPGFTSTWETTRFPRYDYNIATGEFEQVS
jgi:hypothetical protein